MVEHLLPKQRVVGSIPIARSRYEMSLEQPSGGVLFPQSECYPLSGDLSERRFQIRLEAISCIGRWPFRTDVLTR